MKNLSPNGVTLNIDEKMQVTLALTQLQTEMNFEELYFWGKVEGKSLNEFIHGGLNHQMIGSLDMALSFYEHHLITVTFFCRLPH